MSTRTALKQSRWVTFAVVFGFVWTGLIAWRVYDAMNWRAADYVGPSVVSGVAGLVVLAGLFALLVALFGELGETAPTPDTWPPE